MRPYPLTVMKGGINRLRVKGAARADMLYDLLNAYVTNAGSVTVREGTIRNADLSGLGTKGLMAMEDELHVFGTSEVSVPAGYELDLLIHPTDSSQTLKKIWFAKPFMGFPYVVAEFANGDIFNYWLQSSGTWTASTVYFEGSIVTPTVPNGLAYQATRVMPPNPTWSAASIHAAGDLIEPTEYTGFAYRAIAVSSSPGTSAFSGETEPTWPTVAGGTIQEFGNFNTVGSNNSSVATGGPSPLSKNITDRYGNSIDIAGQTGVATTVTIPTAANVVTTWQPGTLYAPGAVVRPGTNQGAFINAIPNGDFEAGDDGNWVKTAGASVSVATGGATPYQGTFMGLLSCNHSTESLTMNTFGTVTPGQHVHAQAYVSTDASGTDLESWVVLRWYTSADVFISETLSTGQFGNGSTNNYKIVSVEGNAPPTATRCRVQLRSSNGTSTRDSQWDLVVWSLEQPAAVSNFLYEAVQSNAATSGTAQPTWPTTAGNTVVDGGVTWEAIGTSIITWQAIPIMQSGTGEPTFPTDIGSTVLDPSTYTSKDSHSTDTSMTWTCVNRMITDSKCPNNPAVALGASHVFEGDTDIVDFSAAVDPTDWSSTNNAGYLPTGLNNYGDNPVKVLALYRSNLMAFNASGYQMWQIDPDPQNMALLDAQPIGSIYTQAAQSIANDLIFLTEVGVRNIGTVGATANMQIGNTGQPVDPLVVAQIKAGTYYPFALYYPGRGQYWIVFGPQAFVLTINGAGTRSWSRYVFPDAITDWAINESVLYLRSAGDLIWKLDSETLADDVHTVSANTAISLTTSHNFLAPTNIGFLEGDYGSVSPTTITGNDAHTYTIESIIDDGVSNIFLVQLDDPGALATQNSVFDSVSFTDKNSVLRTFDANVATFSDAAGTAQWSWPRPAGALYNDNSSYTVNFGITSNVSTPFSGVMQWPYLEQAAMGVNKMLIGLDVIGDGAVTIQIAYREDDPTTFSDNAGFSSSLNVTAPYLINTADTIPGNPIPIPVEAPSYSLILTWSPGQSWTWDAANFYVVDNGGRGFR